ncbi:iron(III) transport system permease protein [Actinacidiphila yanglinensis]|uniref:Iron(III) transport system permease protein n=1 Tax=Actinacidiphila yanglinensis TaxID=310779 RepID=A0A1H6DXV2_9ACTN|nr:iron ABC transporter permease [Actinacidiphila yanglinensis]SEG89563.1 iron(III) transport system permease protein [Actinacidiphila yanglinensis]
MSLISRSRPAPPPTLTTPPARSTTKGLLRWFRDPRNLLLALVALVVAYLAIVPAATMAVASLQSQFLSTGPVDWTFRHYTETLGTSDFWTLVGNSFAYAGATAAISTVVGFGLAYLVSRTDTPAKFFAQVAALVPLIIPGILNTVAWALLFAPHTGALNVLLRDVHLPAFDIYSLAGMVLVQSMHVTPVAFLMGTAAFSQMDSSLEEAALASGAPPRRVFRTITVRLIRPAIMSAVLLMFVQTISTFEVPQLIGVPGRKFVFVSKIYNALQAFPTDYGTVGVIGVFILVVAALGLWLSRRLGGAGAGAQTISGKGFRPTVTELGRWRWLGLALFVLFFLVAVALPLLMLVWSSLLPGYEPPSVSALHHLTLSNYREIWHTPGLVDSVRNSLITAVLAGAVVTVISALVAYITVKTKARGRGLLDGLATIPLAVPSVVMGVGILYWYLTLPLPIHLYGTLTILVIAFVTIGLPYGLRYIVPGMSQIKDELEEAAAASGANWPRTFWRIYVPLLVPSLAAAFLYTVIVAFREISAAIFLYTQGTQVVSVTIYQQWSNGSYPIVAALGVVIVVFLAVIVAIVRLLTRRFGLNRQ